jgi:hypothetical protein
MLAESRRAAYERGITNIRWVQALAEDLPGAAPGPYRVVTFGQSFHWTDQARVAEAVYDMLAPGGALALIVHTVQGRPAPPSPGPPPIPHAEIKVLVEKYLGSTRRAGQGIAPVRTHRFEDVLVRTRFGAPRAIFAPGIPDLLRDSESVLSGYFSMSSSAPHLFGDRGRGLRQRGAGAADVTVSRGHLLGLARRYRGDPRPQARLRNTRGPSKRRWRLLIKVLHVNSRNEILSTYRVVTDVVCALPSSLRSRAAHAGASRVSSTASYSNTLGANRVRLRLPPQAAPAKGTPRTRPGR